MKENNVRDHRIVGRALGDAKLELESDSEEMLAKLTSKLNPRERIRAEWRATRSLSSPHMLEDSILRLPQRIFKHYLLQYRQTMAAMTVRSHLKGLDPKRRLVAKFLLQQAAGLKPQKPNIEGLEEIIQSMQQPEPTPTQEESTTGLNAAEWEESMTQQLETGEDESMEIDEEMGGGGGGWEEEEAYVSQTQQLQLPEQQMAAQQKLPEQQRVGQALQARVKRTGATIPQLERPPLEEKEKEVKEEGQRPIYYAQTHLLDEPLEAQESLEESAEAGVAEELEELPPDEEELSLVPRLLHGMKIATYRELRECVHEVTTHMADTSTLIGHALQVDTAKRLLKEAAEHDPNYLQLKRQVAVREVQLSQAEARYNQRVLSQLHKLVDLYRRDPAEKVHTLSDLRTEGRFGILYKLTTGVIDPLSFS
jgi:CRISPR/Cas system-associated exonuclease Cas4 (RecB family)